jgi:predicted SprT family Zn-dependent metalloprotease|tara:strand:- start:3 stop:365 length:363 start_codon:yes stop_codon:yes gene_type:complete
MKLDDDIKLSILEKIGIYSNRFSIIEPQVFLTNKQVLLAPKNITEGRRTTAYKYYGVAYLEHNSIFINVKKIPDEKSLENTIVHELIHHRFPYLSHGKRFNKIVRECLKGKTFHPYLKRK